MHNVSVGYILRIEVEIKPTLFTTQDKDKDIVEAAKEVGLVHYQVLARLHDVDENLEKKGGPWALVFFCVGVHSVFWFGFNESNNLFCECFL